ncbi:MAG TPA: ferrous iron transport protein B [Clostridia bacterium]|nr:ferrous iron transport protein B [Clostridia bacterium]
MSLACRTFETRVGEELFGIKIDYEREYVVALAGNPNVGKSTLFNNLTGMKQHTGNWPGKTVANARGVCRYKDKEYVMVDLPGTYSLMAHSQEEEVARDFVCFARPDAVIVVCDATCLERNLNLVLQTMEISKNVVVCVNLMDEAKRKRIGVDTYKLSKMLKVPVVGITARKKSTLKSLLETMSVIVDKEEKTQDFMIKYPEPIERAIAVLEPVVSRKIDHIDSRWLCLKLLDNDESIMKSIENFLPINPFEDGEVASGLEIAYKILEESNISKEDLRDIIVSSIVRQAERISKSVVFYEDEKYVERDRKIDRIITGKYLGYPLMMVLLFVVFWITIRGANYPSAMLARFFFFLEERITYFLELVNAPNWLHGILVLGVYRVLAWVVSVMLPPMAIFFPLFTILEDLGYLPRVAFNLDKYFKKASSCGKQALTMCMGFGCNAVGVTGCRIIDSPRERLIAIITNNFVPCNGRFPTLIAVITMFFTGYLTGLTGSLVSSLILTLVIVMGVVMTFLISGLLSKTILKGVPSSFTLELPPYRRPQVLKVIVRSIFDRTLFVLGRAVIVAAPAGAIIWMMANIHVGGETLLGISADFLDPFGKLLGLDGVIVLAFILGFPANEIVVPIIIMAYMAQGSLIELGSLSELKELLVANGWTLTTAISMMLFTLFHWPCSTTCLTIRKETKSIKWTVLSFAIPTLVGIGVCFIFASTVRLLGLIINT